MCIPISPDFHDISAALLPPALLPPRSLARALARSSSTVSPTAAKWRRPQPSRLRSTPANIGRKIS